MADNNLFDQGLEPAPATKTASPSGNLFDQGLSNGGAVSSAPVPPPVTSSNLFDAGLGSPNNGQPVDGGITDADLETLGKPSPEPIDIVANQRAAEAFVESLDPTPTKEEQAGFTARVRVLAAAGAQNQDLKNYILDVGKKDDPKQLTVANWNKALRELETALAESKDKLKEVTKNAPLPEKF